MEDIERNTQIHIISKKTFQRCFKQWKTCWNKCVECQGDNFIKKKLMFHSLFIFVSVNTAFVKILFESILCYQNQFNVTIKRKCPYLFIFLFLSLSVPLFSSITFYSSIFFPLWIASSSFFLSFFLFQFLFPSNFFFLYFIYLYFCKNVYSYFWDLSKKMRYQKCITKQSSFLTTTIIAFAHFKYIYHWK